MNRTKHLQAVCGRCGGAVRCPVELIGAQTQCPHCGELAEMLLAVPTQEIAAPRKLMIASVIAIVVLVLSLAACLYGLRWVEKHQSRHKTPAGSITNLPARDVK